MPLKTLTNRLNFQFKKNNIKISIEEFFYASPSLLIRRSVEYKTYIYSIDANLQGRSYNVFQRQKLVWNIEEKIDVQRLRDVLAFFKGRHNFLSFTVQDSRYKFLNLYERTVSEVVIEEVPHEQYKDVQSIRVHISGKSFMKYQVRYMIGFAYLFSKGQFSWEDVRRYLNPEKIDFTQFDNKNRLKAPSWGLCLDEVKYPENLLSKEFAAFKE